MDYQERDESSCLTLTEAFSIVSLSFLCGASLIIITIGTVLPFAKYIFGFHLSICWSETIANSYNTAIGRGLDVAILGVLLFSVYIIAVLLTCVHHEKRLSLDFYGWTFFVSSISMVIVISILNPIGSKPVKIMIISCIPANNVITLTKKLDNLSSQANNHVIIF